MSAAQTFQIRQAISQRVNTYVNLITSNTILIPYPCDLVAFEIHSIPQNNPTAHTAVQIRDGPDTIRLADILSGNSRYGIALHGHRIRFKDDLRLVYSTGLGSQILPVGVTIVYIKVL